MDATQQLSWRYAQAFLNIFAHELTINDIYHIQALKFFLEKHRLTLSVLKISSLSSQLKRDLLKSLFASHHLTSIWLLLVDLLMKDRRIFLLVSVLASIEQQLAYYKNAMQCTITSSHKLSEHQCNALIVFMEHKTGKKIIAHYVIDASLIAGISITSETYCFEHSVRRQLQRMREPRIQKGYHGN